MLCFALMFVFGYILHGLESSPMLEVSWYVFWVTFVIVSKVDLNLAIFCYFHCNHVEPAKRLVEISLHREGALRPILVWTSRGGFERCVHGMCGHCGERAMCVQGAVNVPTYLRSRCGLHV